MITSVLLTILKIILIVLLSAVALITLITCAVLFIPIGYNIDVDKYDEINVSADISWLFKAVRFVYTINKSKPEAAGLYILGYNLLGKKVKMQSKPEPHNEPSIYSESKPAKENIQKPAEKNDKQHTPVKRIVEEEKTKDDTVKPKGKKAREKRVNKSKKTKNRKSKKNKPEKNGFSDILRQVWEYQYKKEIFNSLILLFKRIINALSNIKLKARLKVGGGEPHKTGYILALIYAVSGTLGFDISAEADGSGVVLKGTSSIKGRITVGSLVFAFMAFIFNKRIWLIVKKIIF